jgi:parallel beta-helix repeat protein
MPPTPRTRRLASTLVAATALLAASAPAASAATFHVSPRGSDTATGTSTAPLRTIAKAASLARRGDTVLVASGRYAEQVTLTSRSAGVTFRGDRSGSARAVIDGERVRRFGFHSTSVNDLTVEGFEITGQTDAGVYLYGLRGLVRDNVIHHVGSAALQHSNGVRVSRGADNRVTANTVHHIGPGGESMGIWLVQTRNALVDGNTVYAVRKEGVRDWQGLDNTIRGNRVFLNWVGIAFNTSTGGTATNNYVYDNVEGLVAKHTSYPTVLTYWGLTTPRWSRFVHNTVWRSTEASVWIAQSDQPADYLDIRNNIFDDAGTTLVRDAPALRGGHVIVDGNAYAFRSIRPAWVYKAGWSSTPGLTSWDTYRSQLGWEQHGLVLDPALRDPAAGDLDYAADSPAASGSLALDDPLGRQLGARGLPPAGVRWTPYRMTAIDSSSKGTTSTLRNLPSTADDNQNSYWLTATPQNEYVTYDFGQARTFDHLVLTLFSHGDKRNPRGYRFEVSDDAVSWRQVLAGQNPDAFHSSYKYELPAATTARYLRFTMVDTFCTSYAPRTGCGTQFVLSDLKAGRLG